VTKGGRIAFGVVGGLLPVLVSFVTLDQSAIAQLIDKHEITEGLCVGYGLRVLSLAALGGIMAFLNSDVTAPLTLVQLGVAAPALVTSYLTGASINNAPQSSQTNPGTSIVGIAYAEEYYPYSVEYTTNVLKISSFLSDMADGFKPGLGTDQSKPDTIVAPSPTPGHHLICSFDRKSQRYTNCSEVLDAQ
jgi:hypothetical protein